jgi:hypothetical protein
MPLTLIAAVSVDFGTVASAIAVMAPKLIVPATGATAIAPAAITAAIVLAAVLIELFMLSPPCSE